MDQEFQEKIDAMRMTLEFAVHDIEARRANMEAMSGKIEALGVKIEAQYETSQVLLKATDNLLQVANRQQDDTQTLRNMTAELARIANNHDQRITGPEGRA